MNAIETKDSDIPPELKADADVIIACVMAGKPVPADVARRIHERSERIKQEVFEKHGILDIGVPAIRELRGELPEP